MFDLKACVVCLSTAVKFNNMDSGQLRREYNLISGLKTQNGNGLPTYMCIECTAYVKRFIKFRNKCQRAYYTLLQLLEENKEITEPLLNEINRKRIKVNPSLSYLDTNNAKVKYESVKFKWVKESRVPTESNNIPILQYSTISDDVEFEVPTKRAKIDNEVTNQNITLESKAEKDLDLNKDETHSDDYFDNNEIENNDTTQCFDNDNEDDVDGSNLDEEYASVVPITLKEAKAVVEVYKMFSQGKFQCDVCGKAYYTEARLKIHMRMHDTHTSGKFFCDLCSYYYKTEFQLKTHISGKHMYKYICRKCPEVSFDRTSAKQHFIWTHLQKGSKKHSNWYETKPWTKGKKQKSVLSLRPVRKTRKLPSDFPVYSPMSQEEQYEIVKQRRLSKNYLDSAFKCDQCFRGFRESSTYENHMKKHDPNISGKYQCDACKVFVVNPRQMYKHMTMSHLFKYSCQLCSYTCFSRGQAKLHYRWHKNVTYSCPHCKKEFVKASTRLTHIRIKHPSTFICTLCGHSFVSETGLYCHKKIVHTKEEIEASEQREIEPNSALYCAECALQFHNEAAFATHFGSSNKHADTNLSIKPVKAKDERKSRGRPRRSNSNILNNGMATASNCEICKKFLSNDVQARKHYESEHPGADFLKRYMCDICGHTTRQHANLMVHMRTHTLEKPYACPHCERRFSMPSNRDRHLVVHTGEKRFQCEHCNRRFTQSSAVKLHIQTVHLKIPYAPWDKKNRKRRKDLEATAAVALQKPETQSEYINAYMFNL
ncbi:zinc finger protein 271-like [Zerene cesonia]|uniref:zinc finger protein 271-like n=1 Tax=Zerene cesonia TaxID=33412 RepID=UPI0018E531B6|nr:zinc finger protein 271-like [Zerene cesonia]